MRVNQRAPPQYVSSLEDATAEALSADSILAAPFTRPSGKSQFPHVVSYIHFWRMYLYTASVHQQYQGLFWFFAARLALSWYLNFLESGII